MTQNNEQNKIDPLEARRKRLRFRSWHRGTKEMDVLLGSFADAHITNFSEDEVTQFERLLNNSDPDLYNWISGYEPLPPSEDSAVMQKLLNFDLTK